MKNSRNKKHFVLGGITLLVFCWMFILSQGPTDHAKLETLQKDLEARGTKAFLVARHGKIVYEWYSREPTKRHYTASLAKALVGGMSLLVALHDGRIHLDDPAWKYIPTWKNDLMKSKITIWHLATHSSGIENPTGEIGKPIIDLPGWKGDYRRDWKQRFPIAIVQAPVLFAPGTQMVYSNTGMTALAYALSASLKGAPQSDIYTLLKGRIMEPLGIPNSDWKISYRGRVKMNGFQLYEIGGGAAYTARAAARVGQLLIQKGNWKGQQLIDSVLIEKMISYDKAPMADDFKHHPRASLGWWTNRDGVWPELPRDAFVGAGRGHQILLVIPSLDLVAVRFGKSLSKKSGYGFSGDFWIDLEKFFLNPLIDAVFRG